VLVLGSGIAGAAAALAAAEAGREVVVLRKPPAEENNTRWAQGGIAAALGATDSWERHAADTLRVGCGLADEGAVSSIVRRGATAIEWLEALGVVFDHTLDRSRALSREGGHSCGRVLSAGGDGTGREIQRQLERALRTDERITVRNDLRAVDVLVRDGVCCGVVATDAHDQCLLLLASSTVLATGAVGQIYRETTNPVVATGDGIAMAFRAGVSLADLEFVQFHPTTLYIAGAARVLISEAVRGAGAVLVDREGRRVMQGQHPDLDLAPRDVVSRAILSRMVETGDTHVYLDASGIPDVRRRFPGIARMCEAFGLDIGTQPIPVRPGAHYMIGGVRTGLDARTDMPGLFACGEAAATGLHGANRLASNSLLEGLVMGRVAGAGAAESAVDPDGIRVSKLDDDPHPPRPRAAETVALNLDDMLYSLKSLMWRQAGLMREAFALADAESKIRFWERVLLGRMDRGQKFIDLANMLLVSRLVCAASLFREESRGTHFRRDFPETKIAWEKHVVVRRQPVRGHE
jgi:L-aspartate oxidase